MSPWNPSKMRPRWRCINLFAFYRRCFDQEGNMGLQIPPLTLYFIKKWYLHIHGLYFKISNICLTVILRGKANSVWGRKKNCHWFHIPFNQFALEVFKNINSLSYAIIGFSFLLYPLLWHTIINIDYWFRSPCTLFLLSLNAECWTVFDMTNSIPWRNLINNNSLLLSFWYDVGCSWARKNCMTLIIFYSS